MKKLSAAFGSLPMTWPVVCVSAAIIGVYVGVINQIPILYDTSFRDIAVSYEWWVLFAVLIVSNCKSAREAGKEGWLAVCSSEQRISRYRLRHRRRYDQGQSEMCAV